MENKRGLSAIVATLIIILLVLVAVGIVWVVVNSVIKEGAEDIEINAKCLQVSLEAVSVVPYAGEAGNYSVTLHRTGTGDEIGGVKISLFNETDNSGVLEGFLALGLLATETEKFEGVTNSSRLDYTAFFIDDSGNDKLCGQTGSYSF